MARGRPGRPAGFPRAPVVLGLLVVALAGLGASARGETPDEVFEHALSLQRAGRWTRARKAFWKLIERYPDSPRTEAARLRSGDNAFLGVVRLRQGGPAERRIDVSVMGDGFTLRDQDQVKQKRWAALIVDVLLREKTLAEYADYFNFYFVRLCSRDRGVDPGGKRGGDEDEGDRFVTALECRAAGPHGQVMADRRLVYRWLGVAAEEMPDCADDRYVIAFARFGVLGMATGGVANMGRPDQHVAVHEFGHAFSRLLDEYVRNTGSPHPRWAKSIRAANAATTSDPRAVPWAHLISKRVKGIGVYEGGATFAKGVWRPARTCAMNVGGAPFCAACREATVLVIYEYVAPIDEATPSPERELTVLQGGEDRLSVTPMRPAGHALTVCWFVEPITAGAPGPEAPPVPSDLAGDPDDTGDIAGDLTGALRRKALPFAFHGPRSVEGRDSYADPPGGRHSRLGKARRGRRGVPPHHVFPLGKLEPGRYRVTAQVTDPTPWVVRDPTHLLEQRVTWWVTVEE